MQRVLARCLLIVLKDKIWQDSLMSLFKVKIRKKR